MVRDFQQERVYRMEQTWRDRFLHRRPMSPRQLEAWVLRGCEVLGVSPCPIVVVPHMKILGQYTAGEIHLSPQGARRPSVVLHEVVHLAVTGGPHHGPVFVSRLFDVVEECLHLSRSRLEERARRFGVEWS